MKTKIKIFVSACFIIWGANANAQSVPGEISGTVTDTNGIPIPATITYEVKGKLQGIAADEKGAYRIKPLDAGKYNVSFSLTGFNKKTFTDITVSSGQITSLNVKLNDDNTLTEVVITYHKNLFEKDETMRADVLDATQIQNSLARDPREFVATTSQANSRDDGQAINIRGSRTDATQYYVDGIKMIGGFSIPKSAIKEIKVISGGVPAMFGDATGGIVLITTKSYWDN